MSKNSLFAYLMRSSWWVSFAIAAVLALLARFVLPQEYAWYAFSFTIPFVVIGTIVAWRDRNAPSAKQVASTLEAITAMSWRDFSALVEQAYQREGYEVTRMNGAADFRLVKAGRMSLLSCKRWKAATHGLEPLRELKAARQALEAREAVYVAAGNLSENARRFATDHGIVLMQGPELARLIRLPKGKAKTAR